MKPLHFRRVLGAHPDRETVACKQRRAGASATSSLDTWRLANQHRYPRCVAWVERNYPETTK